MSDNLPAVKAAIVANPDGVLVPRDFDEAYRLANVYAKSGLLPERYKTPEMVMTAMQFALELGLKPLTGMRQIAVIKGTPAAFGDLPLSLCYAKGKLERIKEFLVDEKFVEICFANKNMGSAPFAAVCIVKRFGDSEVLERYFTMKDAQSAGLLNSPTWKSYPQYMLTYRARSMALKSKFPDCLNGVSIAEYDHNEAPEMTNVTPPIQAESREEPMRQGAQAGSGSLAERMRMQETETVMDAQYS